MRLPKIQQYDKNITKEIVEINDLTFEPKFYDLGKDKDKFKFITTVEKLCRTSMEYYDLINFLRINMGMDFCSFFHKVSKNAYGKTRIKRNKKTLPGFLRIQGSLCRKISQSDPQER